MRGLLDEALLQLTARQLNEAERIREALREFFEQYDTYGFNCGLDQSYLDEWVKPLREFIK